MKKLAFLLVLVVAFAMMAGSVLAAETPHGPFDDNSAVCAACHRAHTSSAEYLLATPKVTSLCIGCHDGTGADTNVVDGIYVVNGSEYDKDNPVPTLASPPNGYNHGTWGAAASPLMGGGFLKILNTTNTTSKHMNPTGGAGAVTFGVQFGEGAAPGVAKTYLDCVDCHMPHRSTNYRMLRVKPTGSAYNNLKVPDAASVTSDNTVVSATNATETDSYTAGHTGRKYTEDSGMFNYTIDNVDIAPSTTEGNDEGISKWCGFGCHEFYYRSAVRTNNGAGGGVGVASPQMQIRVTTSVALGSQPTVTLNVNATSAITEGATYVWVGGYKFLVQTKTATSITTDTVIPGHAAGFWTGADILAGQPVSIEGKGMEVYYDLNADSVADTNFMHAVDVDLNYTPRNGSSNNQTLAANLHGTGGIPGNQVAGGKDRLPVADTGATVGAYDNGDMLTCLTCHRAHGTEVAMSGDAAIPARTISGKAFPAGNNSMLLRLGNRGVCQQCHNMPNGF